MVSHGHCMFVRPCPSGVANRTRRGEVWTIDPLFHRKRQSSPHRHPRALPGRKDYAILAWLVHLKSPDGGPEFNLAQPAAGMEDIRAALSGFDRATASAIAGVTEQELDDLLAAIRRKGHVDGRGDGHRRDQCR